MAHTNRHLARDLGIALLLAATFLAALFLATLSPPGPASVAAHPCATGTPADTHVDFRSRPVPCSTPTHQTPHHIQENEVDGGRDRELVFKAYVPKNVGDFDDTGDSIVIEFDDSFDLPDSLRLTKPGADPNDMPINLITINRSGSTDTKAITDSDNAVPKNDKKELTLIEALDFSSPLEADEYITITIREGTGIETPETPRGFDGIEEGYEVLITFVDAGDIPPVIERIEDKNVDRNLVVVRNPISSTVPSATVRVELHTHTNPPISETDEIIVDFSGPSADSGFVVPNTISTSRIQVRYNGNKTFNPSEVVVQGERVVFAVPEKETEPISFMGDYSITFTNLARIRNPFSAGIYEIKVSSFVSEEVDTIEAVVRRTTTLSPPEGARGTEFTLEGKGYAAGTVTVYHDANDNERIDPGETLASEKTVRGAFKAKLTAQGEPGSPKYKIRARDSEGEDVTVEFDIRSSISFEPPIVAPGSQLTIIITDWEEGRDEVVAVQIAGESVQFADRDAHSGDEGTFLSQAIKYEYCIHHPDSPPTINGRITLNVDVPSNIPPGEQTVAVFDHRQLDYSIDGRVIGDNDEDRKPCTRIENEEEWGRLDGNLTQKFRSDDPIAVTKSTVEIEGRSLTLSPATAVRGQRVTVSGFGFGRGGNLTSVSINGEPVAERPEQFEVSTTGFISITVTVPPNTPVGTNEVRVTGANNTLGTGALTVPEPAVTLSPSESRAGTEVTVTGTGLIANTPVRVTYADTHVAAGFANASGNVSLPFRVPLSAEIGRSYPVTVQAEVSGIEVSASATHSPALSTIATEPAEVSVGDLLTVSGRDLPPFAIVRPIEIDGRNVTPFPAPTADATGAFEVEVRVPGTPVGDQPLRVVAGSVVLTHTITVVPLPLSGPPARVFRDLINEGSLIAVWRYVNESQVWNLFDPNVPEELSELNDLTYVGTGDIVWLETKAQVEFQGDILNAGWSLIRLK